MFTKAIALALIGAGAVQAGGHEAPTGHMTKNNTVITVTEVVKSFTTFCPEPTHLTMNNKTFTVTEACTFTFTNCPCTVTRVIPQTGQPQQPSKPEQTQTQVPGVTKGPAPTVAPPVVGAAGQNTAAYGVALAGALAAAAVAL